MIAAAIRVLLVTCAAAAVAAQGQPPASAQAEDMRAHFNEAMVVHAAVIRGDLAAVAPAARVLADQDPASLPPGASRHVAAMKEAAREAVEARDLLAAGQATGRMLIACGACHRAVSTMPAFANPPRSTLGGVVGHMLEHQLAVDQMLRGLVVPSDTMWRAGARGMATAPLSPRDLPVDSAVRRELAPTEERVHRLATDAAQAADPFARAGFYGQMLAGCADCHKRHAKIWGPKP